MRPVHSGQLERWLGRAACEHLSLAMRGWYAKPILLAGVPGGVYVGGDGDFYGTIKAGREASVEDRLRDSMRSFLCRYRRACRPLAIAGAGFPSLFDLIYEANNGKLFPSYFDKSGGTNTTAASFDYFQVASVPTNSGYTASGPPSGNVLTSASIGAFKLPNVVAGDQLHFVNGWVQNAGGAVSMLLYDRLFEFAKTMSSTTADSISAGLLTRYQNTNANAWDSAEGNFVSNAVSSALSATAHTNTLVYTKEDGTNNITAPGGVGLSGCIAVRIDLGDSSIQWFHPLATGDRGVKEIESVTCNASVTGGMVYFVGHPIAWLPSYSVALIAQLDGIQNVFQMQRLHTDACLALLHVARISGSQTNTRGQINLVSG